MSANNSHLQTLPAGTHKPNTASEVPGQGLNPSLGGTTSAAVHNDNQFGKPLQDMEGRELGGSRDHKKERSELEEVGASTGKNLIGEKGSGLPKHVGKGSKGKADPDYPSATDQVPESAETVAAENSGPKCRVYGWFSAGNSQ
ncbi:uncharacterized protein BCR38DRAFT_483150 [Pseudomassariella vexata]|uniref:Uncharacterized protein n=1 Tax=Pseudomassariella vexata TaxID=1141098 RepID=A0A1Y2E9J8_9PEZI|nr:uncharacterized protein BCR38DRAFT_483150 [Pseudomassariella vexata]ORY67535.1 hypothetical protein BCR38DRAFT_483150 [Pseudomassariella vexata]